MGTNVWTYPLNFYELDRIARQVLNTLITVYNLFCIYVSKWCQTTLYFHRKLLPSSVNLESEYNKKFALGYVIGWGIGYSVNRTQLMQSNVQELLADWNSFGVTSLRLRVPASDLCEEGWRDGWMEGCRSGYIKTGRSYFDYVNHDSILLWRNYGEPFGIRFICFDHMNQI